MNIRAALTSLLIVLPTIASAQSPAGPEIEACRSTGLVALKERSSAVKDVYFDLETFSVAKANTQVEDTPVRTVMTGEA